MTQYDVAEAFSRLSPQEAKQRIDRGEVRVVDVRENWEYARDHIPGAELVTLGRIIADPAGAVSGSSLLFVCEVGQRSAVAAELAAAAGVERVFNLEGGMQAWRSAGLATET